MKAAAACRRHACPAGLSRCPVCPVGTVAVVESGGAIPVTVLLLDITGWSANEIDTGVALSTELVH
ncbi:hypothetical protein GCM10027073_08920 [Streptomyces chlorus]